MSTANTVPRVSEKFQAGGFDRFLPCFSTFGRRFLRTHKLFVFAYRHSCDPRARTLPQIVLLTFQASELPRLPDAVRWICGRFGAVIAVDGLSAPLQEAR